MESLLNTCRMISSSCFFFLLVQREHVELRPAEVLLHGLPVEEGGVLQADHLVLALPQSEEHCFSFYSLLATLELHLCTLMPSPW